LLSLAVREVFLDDSTWSSDDKASFRAITWSLGSFLLSYAFFRFAAIASSNDEPGWKAIAWLVVGGIAVLLGVADLVAAIVSRS